MRVNLTPHLNPLPQGERKQKLRAKMYLLFTITVLPAVGASPPAYIDPTAGGVLVQILLGSAAGALLIAKLFWRRLRRALSRKRHGGQPEAHEHSHETPH